MSERDANTTGTCPNCGVPVRADQDWCLNCGAALTTTVASTPNWRAPLAIVAAVLALAAAGIVVAFLELSDDAGDDVAAVPATTSAPEAPAPTGPSGPTGVTGPTSITGLVVPTGPTGPSGITGPTALAKGPGGASGASGSSTKTTPTVPTIPPATGGEDLAGVIPPGTGPSGSKGSPGSSGSGSSGLGSTGSGSTGSSSTSGSWPAGKEGWTVILASTRSKSDADKKAASFATGGTSTGILHSDDFSSLRSGYYVVFSGQYDSRSDASDAAERLRSKAPDAYVRFVKPR